MDRLLNSNVLTVWLRLSSSTGQIASHRISPPAVDSRLAMSGTSYGWAQAAPDSPPPHWLPRALWLSLSGSLSSTEATNTRTTTAHAQTNSHLTFDVHPPP